MDEDQKFNLDRISILSKLTEPNDLDKMEAFIRANILKLDTGKRWYSDTDTLRKSPLTHPESICDILKLSAFQTVLDKINELRNK